MKCPNCGGQETAINEIDDSVCCINCGNVLEINQLITECYIRDPQNIAPIPRAVEKGRFQEWFSRIALYFRIGDEITEQSRIKLAEASDSLPNNYPKEVAVGTVIRFANFLHPKWTYDDYIAAFPLALYKPAVIKTYLILGGDNYSWVKSTKRQFDYIVELIYPTIVQQLFVSKPPPQFNIYMLKRNTHRLLHLGGDYGINYGLKMRPLIIAVSCLCALNLRTKIPTKYISGKRPKAKRKTVKLCNNKINYHYIWSFKGFALISFCSEKYLRKCYSIYYQFITLCAQKFNWLPQPIHPKEVFFHLEDVLALFSKSEKKEAMMKLPREWFYPVSFVESVFKTRLTIDSLKQAKEYLRDGHHGHTDLMDKESIAYCFYRLLKEGYSEKQLFLLTLSQVKNLSYIIDYRLTFDHIQDKNDDLDRKLIAEDDMCDEEISLYMK